MSDLASRYAALKQVQQQKEQVRIRAETTVQHARQRLAEVDAEIRQQGIEPDQLDAELAKLTAQLSKDADTIEQQLQAELTALQAIVQGG